MIFFCNNSGTIIKSLPSPVYQGGANTNTIYLVAPFAANSSVTVIFKLPNGVATAPALMTKQADIPDIKAPNGAEYAVWSYALPNTVTQKYGTVTAQFMFYNAVAGAVTPTSAVSFEVGRGVPGILPSTPEQDIYEQILNAVASLQEQLDNGIYAARAIYWWNGSYKYGAAEMTYYPVGQYGAFVQSVRPNNLNHAPYNESGMLNSTWWREIVNFNNVTAEYFTLIQNALEEAQNAAAEAQNAATRLGDYIGKQIAFVSVLPAVGQAGVLYGLVTDSSNNLFDIYKFDNGWAKIGSSQLVLQGTYYTQLTLPADAWENNAQTIEIQDLTAADEVGVAPIDDDADVWINDGIVTEQIAGGITFRAATTPTETLTVNVGVTKKQVIPTAAEYFTREQVSALAVGGGNLTLTTTDYKLTLILTAIDGTTLATSTVDFPDESLVKSGYYDNDNKQIVLVLEDGSNVDVPVGDLVSELATKAELQEVIDGTTPVAQAINATNAVNAQQAARATQADSADKVDNTLTITLNGTPVLFDGSEAQSVNIVTAGGVSVTIREVTIAPEQWVNNAAGVPENTVTPLSIVQVSPADSSAAVFILSGITTSGQAQGSVTFSCTATPTVAVTLEIIIIN